MADTLAMASHTIAAGLMGQVMDGNRKPRVFKGRHAESVAAALSMCQSISPRRKRLDRSVGGSTRWRSGRPRRYGALGGPWGRQNIK